MTTVLTFYVVSMEGMALIAVAEGTCQEVCWFAADKPSTSCNNVCILFLYLLSTFVMNKRYILCHCMRFREQSKHSDGFHLYD